MTTPRADGSPDDIAGSGPLFEGGWYRHAARRPSPHFDERPPGSAVDLLVLHNISLPAGVFGGQHIDALFLGRLDPAAHPDFASLAGVRVSSHFLIRRDGALLQYVSCDARAWHAGVSNFAGRERCNDFSIGIELEGSDTSPFTEAQYESLHSVTAALLQAYPIRAVAGHCDIAPGRKTDPGPHFDWARMRRECALPAAALPFATAS